MSEDLRDTKGEAEKAKEGNVVSAEETTAGVHAHPEEESTSETQTAPEEHGGPGEADREQEGKDSSPEEKKTARETGPERKKLHPRRRRRGESGELPGAAPHLTGRESTRGMMADVLIALLPALLFSGIYFFGPRSFLVTAVSVAVCVGAEAAWRALRRERQTVGDLSAVVTGVLLAMTLSVTTPYWVVAIGGLFAIVVVKLLYGGLGKNFMNPALAGRVFLFSFPALINTWAATRTSPDLLSALDAVTAATPMATLHQGNLPGTTPLEMLTGIRGGAIGEVSAALVLLGGLYLVVRRVIRPRIPLCMIGTVALLTWLFPQTSGDRLYWMYYQLTGGGLLLGAFFMATDPVTSPTTGWGQVLYGVGCGALTVFLRYFGAYPEGVAFAILLMNAAAWLFDRVGLMYRRRLRRDGVRKEESGHGA